LRVKWSTKIRSNEVRWYSAYITHGRKQIIQNAPFVA
jgi:hypothetical protein